MYGVMGVNGEDAKELFAASEGYNFERIAWFPDGQRLPDMRSHRGYNEVVIESRDGRTRRRRLLPFFHWNA